ncbi:gamma-interferon-responsive lysosomal thiol protein-like [Rosa sericea]
MASHKFFSITVLTALLSLCTNALSRTEYNCSSQKVDLTIYYDTLSPYCEEFIVYELPKAFELELMHIINLRLVPYGNAYIQEPNNTISCQNGPAECYLNSIEACVISIWPDVVCSYFIISLTVMQNKHFKFIHCVAWQNLGRLQLKEHAWKSCSKITMLSDKPVSNCYKSRYAKKLLLRYANETKHLDPPHTNVPWVVINKRPLYYDYKNFVSYVCEAYQGHPKPSACTTPIFSSAKKSNSTRLHIYYYLLHLLSCAAFLIN